MKFVGVIFVLCFIGGLEGFKSRGMKSYPGKGGRASEDYPSPMEVRDEDVEISFTGRSEQTSGSSEEDSGSREDENECIKPDFYKLLSVFRGFPDKDSREMNGYEPDLYEPLLDQFWDTKDKMGVDKALDIFMKDFSRSLFVERYHCKGTQLNQILISILKSKSNSFMPEELKSFKSAIDKIKPKLNDGKNASKDLLDMKNPKTKVEDIVIDAFMVVYAILHENAAFGMESQEFSDVACYLRFVRQNLRREAEADVTTLEQIKQMFAEWSTQDYPSVFQCTEPRRVVEIYRENWQGINLPEKENKVFQLVSQSLKKFLPKFRKSLQTLYDTLHITLSRTIQKFVVKVFNELKPFHEAQSGDEMVEFFQKSLSSDTSELQFAEKLVQSLDIFGTSPMEERNEDVERSFIGRSEQTSGSSEEESGSLEVEDECIKPDFYKLLSVFRGFPKTDSREINGYEAYLYEPLLDQFWETKDSIGVDKALNIFMRDLSRSVFIDRYHCKGTQLNQILISILKKKSHGLFLEGMKSITDAFEQMHPKSNTRRSSYKDMENTKTYNHALIPKVYTVLFDMLHMTLTGHLETGELGDVACYLRFVRENLKSEAEADVTPLEQIKQLFAEWSTHDFSYVFQCTDPRRVVEVYTENWEMVILPEDENELFQLVSGALKKIIPRDRKTLQSVLTRTIQKFVVRVLKELKPFYDAQSVDEMVEFFQKSLSADQLQFAEQLVQSLDLFGSDDMSSEITTEFTPTTPNVYKSTTPNVYKSTTPNVYKSTTPNVYKSFRREIGGKTSTPSPTSGGSESNEDDYGSGEDKDKCIKPAFYKLLSFFRKFPKTENKEMIGYDAATYEPLLDKFWKKKEKAGLDKAIRIFMGDFSKTLLADRYQCKGTQLNQMMIDVLRNTTTNFMAGAWNEIQTVIDQLGSTISVPKPSIKGKRSERVGKNDMKDPKSRLGKIVGKVFWVLQQTLREDVAYHLEKTELYDVACFLEFVRGEVRSEVETGASLAQVKNQLSKWSTQYFPDVFECTDPRRIVNIYGKEWREVNLPENENKLFQHFSEVMKKIIPRLGKGRHSATAVMDDLHITLTRTTHKFAMKVITQLKPFLDARSTSEMLVFFTKFLTPEKLQFAERLIRSLNIFDQTPTMGPTLAPTAAPTWAPTEAPTMAPTAAPTLAPTKEPTMAPTAAPTMAPTAAPTMAPTAAPTMAPTAAPTMAPTAAPTLAPTTAPTKAPIAVTTIPPTSPTLPPTEDMTTAPSETRKRNYYQRRLMLQNIKKFLSKKWSRNE